MLSFAEKSIETHYIMTIIITFKVIGSIEVMGAVRKRKAMGLKHFWISQLIRARIRGEIVNNALVNFVLSHLLFPKRGKSYLVSICAIIKFQFQQRN